MTSHISRLGYSRSDIAVGIAHFGVGNFHRAHQAVYLHGLFEQGAARDWGICGIGVLPGDARMRDALVAGGFEYTHVERLSTGEVRAQRIGSIVDYLFAPEDPEAVLALLASPAIRIVSLTITEGGYNTSSVTGHFDAEAPAIVADLVPGAVPSTVFGLVIEALARRRAAGVPPFTVMSCDNLQGNGAVARGAFTAFAALRDPELGEWVEASVSFPNSMVDRITPATSEQDRRFVAEEFGTADPWPVLSEPYLQWVLEDSFPLGRPPLQRVGVELVADVAPYERMKLRMLNASHQALTYFGLLLGYEFVDEAASDPLIARLLDRYLREEAAPTLDLIPGFDVAGYGATALERFRNPYIRDTLARIATDAADRITTFLLPVAVDGIAAGRPTPLVAAIVASWASYCAWDGRPRGIADRQQALVNAALANPAGFLAERGLFGDVGDSPEFAAAFVAASELITADGPRAALRASAGAE
jgi:mannitol 2-dehydrogenase